MRAIGLLGATVRDTGSYVLGVVVLLYLTLKAIVVRPEHEARHDAPVGSEISAAALRAVPEAAVLAGAIGFGAVHVSTLSPTDVLGVMYVAGLVREAAPLLAAFLLVVRVAPLITVRVATATVSTSGGRDRIVELGQIRHEVPGRLGLCIAAAVCLTAVAHVTAFFAGAAASGLDLAVYTDKIVATLRGLDFPYMILKPILYAAIVCVVSCHQGFATRDERAVAYAPGSTLVAAFGLCAAATGVADGLFYMMIT